MSKTFVTGPLDHPTTWTTDPPSDATEERRKWAWQFAYHASASATAEARERQAVRLLRFIETGEFE